MKNVEKRLVLVFALLVATTALAYAQHYDPESDFYVRLIDGGRGVEITGYLGNRWEINIPPIIQGIPVTTIADRAFLRRNLIRVTIPDSVTSIGVLAFSNNQLISVTIGNSVTSIGDGAFSKNKLTSVIIPDSVTSIGDNAFSINLLTGITIPDSVITIDQHAFNGNQLTSITIPSSVTTIVNNPFPHNPNLTAINVAIDNPNYSSQDGVLYNKTHTILLAWPTGKIPVTIPNGVISIGDWAFSGNRLTGVTIPNSVVSIGDFAFNDNELTNVTIPNSVIYIGNSAFWSNRLTNITIPNSVITIGNCAFWNNHLTSVTIGANVNLNASSINSNFWSVFSNNKRRAGTYTRANPNSTIWRRTNN